MTCTIWSNAGRWEYIVYDGDRVVTRSGLVYTSRAKAMSAMRKDPAVA